MLEGGVIFVMRGTVFLGSLRCNSLHLGCGVLYFLGLPYAIASRANTAPPGKYRTVYLFQRRR